MSMHRWLFRRRKRVKQSMKSLRLLTGISLLAVVSTGSGQTTVADPLGHRLKLSFFEYAGSGDGARKIYFSRYKGILRDKLAVLVEELPDSKGGFSYLQRLSLEPAGEGGLADNLTSAQAAQDYWDQSSSLLLFRGILSSDTSQNYFAESRIYLGNLPRDHSRVSVRVRLPIRSEEYPTTSDTHSLIVYYALAKDAKRMGDDRSRVSNCERRQDKVRELSQTSRRRRPA